MLNINVPFLRAKAATAFSMS